MPFTTTTVPLNFPEQFGFRDDSTGDLSANWSIAQGASTDIQVKLDTVNIAWSPTTAANPVTAIYTPRSTTTPWLRSSVSMRYGTNATGTGVAFGMWERTTFTSFSFSGRLYTVALQADAPTRVRFLFPGGDVSIATALSANTWYRAGMEVIGQRIRFLFNATGDATITNVSNDDSLQVYYETALSDPAPEALFHGISLSNVAVGAADYTGAGDVRFTTLRVREGFNLEGGSAFGFAPGRYLRYKSVRRAVQLFNNVSLQP